MITNQATNNIAYYIDKLANTPVLALCLLLPIGASILKNIVHSIPHGATFSGIQIFPYAWVLPLYVFQFSAFYLIQKWVSFPGELANFHINWDHHLVPCNSGFRIVF
jgi:hypothetical protein